MPNTCCGDFIHNPCPSYPNAHCVVYTGGRLDCIGAVTNDRLDTILGKINSILCSVVAPPTLTFRNGLTQSGTIISLGGILVNDTSIDFSVFNFSLQNVPYNASPSFLLALDSSTNIIRTDVSAGGGGGTTTSVLKFLINEDGTGVPPDGVDGYKPEGNTLVDSRLLGNKIVMMSVTGIIVYDFGPYACPLTSSTIDFTAIGGLNVDSTVVIIYTPEAIP